MLDKIDASEARALAHLRADGNWNTARAWIERSLEKIDIRLRYETGEELKQCQGAAQALTALLEKADEAPEIMQRFKSRGV